MDKEAKKITVVYSFGGQYEDKWENLECAFLKKEDADKYMEEKMSLRGKISDEKYYEIRDYLAELELEIQWKYYDPKTYELYKDKTEEDYNKAITDYEEKEKYDIIKEKYGFTKEEFDTKENDMIDEFCSYMTKEIDLYK